MSLHYPFVADAFVLIIHFLPGAIILMRIMEPKRLSKLEIVRRLFRKYSTSTFSREEKLSAIGRIMTRLSTSILSPREIKNALGRVITKIKKTPR